MDLYRRLPLHKTNCVRDAELRRDAQQQVNVVRHRVSFEQLDPVLNAQVSKNVAYSFAELSEDRSLSVFGCENYVVPTVPSHVR